MSDIDTSFILRFTDSGPAAVVNEFETLSEAIRHAETINRLCEIREIGLDRFSNTKINRIRYVMRA